MSFWCYMLHCADRSFYVGHTDDLEVRIAQHRTGTLRGYTSTRRPVTLVWSDEFPSRYEALSAERQIKGWSRAKKLALIRGDWKLIGLLARNKQERASTSSARTEVRSEPTGPITLNRSG
jgi:predicted GIY-YIG superfamily endonuclease